MKSLFKLLKISFFIFLDISGILLGLFLVGLGLAVIFGWNISDGMGWLLLIIGIGALFLHTGHYFNLKYMKWLFGNDYFIQK